MFVATSAVKVRGLPTIIVKGASTIAVKFLRQWSSRR